MFKFRYKPMVIDFYDGVNNMYNLNKYLHCLFIFKTYSLIVMLIVFLNISSFCSFILDFEISEEIIRYY